MLTPKDVETKSNPTLAGRKEPIYSRLTFTVRAQGDLAAIVEFLEPRLAPATCWMPSTMGRSNSLQRASAPKAPSRCSQTP